MLSPTTIWRPEGVVAVGVRPIACRRVAAHGLEFSEAFDAVY